MGVVVFCLFFFFSYISLYPSLKKKKSWLQYESWRGCSSSFSKDKEKFQITLPRTEYTTVK